MDTHQSLPPTLVRTSPKSVYTRVEIPRVVLHFRVIEVTNRLFPPPPSHSALISTITFWKVERANCVALRKFRVLNTCSMSTWLLAVRHVKWLLVNKIGVGQSAFKHVPRHCSFLERNVEDTG